MDHQIEFDIYELNMIFEDQRGSLENIHQGREMCVALQDCPPEHFGNEDVEDVFIRQEIMKKILTEANNE